MKTVASPISPRAVAFLLLSITLFNRLANAHEHHDEDLPPGQVTSQEPIDSILWTHILVQTASWGLLFPLGMVLGIVRSRWHVPVQTLGTVGAVLGYFLGHRHKGRRFGHNIHSSFAPWVNWTLFAQIILGAYLRLHLEKGMLGRVRKPLVLAHGIIGKALPVVAWVQFLFGGLVAMGFCQGDHTGQCAAHFIMGSAFIAYGIILTILLLVGQAWLKRTNKSQEFFDSIVIAAWGCVNTFTEHRWGGPWVRNDLQHTSMGIIWWCAGLLGIWLSRTRDGRPKRNLIPAIVIGITGYGMSAHPQELMLSTMVHTFFGYTLMAAGLVRMIEIAFVLKDRACVSVDGRNVSSFQFLTPFLLIASGFLFMGATEEQMAVLTDAHVTHVSYILILLSISMLLFLFVNILVHIYAVYMMPESTVPLQSESTSSNRPRHVRGGSSFSHHVIGDDEEDLEANGKPMNGHASQANGEVVSNHLSDKESRRVKDAQEFELDNLLDDEDHEDHARRRQQDRSVAL